MVRLSFGLEFKFIPWSAFSFLFYSIFFFLYYFSFFFSVCVVKFFLVVTFLLGLVSGLGLFWRLGLGLGFGLLDPRVTDSTSILPNLIMFSFTFAFAIYLKKPQCSTFFLRPRPHSDSPSPPGM